MFVGEVAKALRLNPKTVRNRHYRGMLPRAIPMQRPGERLRFLASDVQAVKEGRYDDCVHQPPKGSND